VADLGIYEVPHRNHTATVKLSAEEAKELYGDAAKKVGDVKKAEPQPVTRPPWDSGDVKDPADDEKLVSSRHARGEDAKKAPSPHNKSRAADNKGD